MNGIAIAFTAVSITALLFLPRRQAPLPLLIGACYMTLGQTLMIGPFHFFVIRMLIGAGLVRVVIRSERLAGGPNSMDWLMLTWAAWALFSSLFHMELSDAFVFRLGLVFNTCGIYFLIRVFCQSMEDVVGLCRLTAILLIPIAVEMLYENLTSHNLFSVFGGVAESPAIREGRVRAQGPFAHAILAGTVGATSLPLMVALWQGQRNKAIMGIAACLIIVFASASSGPIMSALGAIGALLMWHYRHRMRLLRWTAVIVYIGLDLVMKAPAYYLLWRIDLSGGSTGYHRAALIDSSLKHINEWWVAGTDYTRHWLATGVSWSPNHTDITNHYLALGVLGGLPLMLLFVAVLAQGFSFVGRAVRQMHELSPQRRFMVWALGASLFAHATTFISVSYFDQSFVFIYLTLAAIGSVGGSVVNSGHQTSHASCGAIDPSRNAVSKAVCDR